MPGKTKLTLLAALCIALLGAGCGDDEPTTSTSTIGVSGLTGASGATGATGEDGTEAEPIDFDEARSKLEAAGFTIEDQAGEDLDQETADGTIEAEVGIRVFEQGDPADVAIQQFASTDDAEAVAKSLETAFFAVDQRDDIVIFAVKDQEALLNEVASAAAG